MFLCSSQVNRTDSELILSVSNITVEDGGQYVCTIDAGGQTTDSAAYIIVAQPGKYMYVLYSKITVNIRNIIDFSRAQTRDHSGYQWKCHNITGL